MERYAGPELKKNKNKNQVLNYKFKVPEHLCYTVKKKPKQ